MCLGRCVSVTIAHQVGNGEVLVLEGVLGYPPERIADLEARGVLR